MKRWLIAVTRTLDVLLAPLTVVASCWLGLVRRAGLNRMPVARSIFNVLGVFPIRDHYYEPLFNPRHLVRSLREPRHLPALDLNSGEQLRLLSGFHYQDELLALPLERPLERAYFYGNESFGSGDSEYLYSVIRRFKPRRMVEIGSGYSTLMAIEALRRNREEDTGYSCDHVCIEPYEMPWLESLGIRVIRERVERAEPRLFDALEAKDILFIDSSHVIRPQGDVLYECLELLPRLRPGVLVHLHDIYTPRDVPDDWVVGQVRFWNEQYLLEAFLSFNREYRIVGALNHLKHDHWNELSARCPVLARQPRREPASFWLQRS